MEKKKGEENLNKKRKEKENVNNSSLKHFENVLSLKKWNRIFFVIITVILLYKIVIIKKTYEINSICWPIVKQMDPY